MRRYRMPLVAIAVLLGLTTTYWFITWINLGGQTCYRVIPMPWGDVWVEYECGGGGGDNPLILADPEGGGGAASEGGGSGVGGGAGGAE